MSELRELFLSFNPNKDKQETTTTEVEYTEFTDDTTTVTVDTPSYYDGDNNYTAIEVVTNFNLNYNLGTACTYILRAYRKHESPNEDIQKAIDHLQFELIKLKTK